MAAALLLATACTSGGEPPPGPPASSAPAAVSAPRDTRGALVYTTGTAVLVRYRDGSVADLATEVEVEFLHLDRTGRYAAYLVVKQTHITVAVHDLATLARRSWVAPDPTFFDRGLAAFGDGFVVALQDDSERHVRFLRFDPDKFLAGGAPGAVRVRGVPDAGILVAAGDRVYVTPGVGADRPERVYAVDADGASTYLFTDTADPPGGDFDDFIHLGAVTADGARLVYANAVQSDRPECGPEPTVVVRDLARNRSVPVVTPRLLGVHTAVSSLTTGPDGRTVVALIADPRCRGPRRAAAFVLEGDRWMRVADDARWLATSADGRTATITPEGALRVDGERVADRVSTAVWSPV